MPRIRYKVTLTQEERQMLQEIATRGRHSSQKVLNAVILMACDAGPNREYDKELTSRQIASVLPISERKIDRIKKRFVEEGLEMALDKRKADREYTRKADGDVEAHLLALSCSEPPDGFDRWSLRLLADKMVELKYVDSISYETVRRTPKKNELKPWRSHQWVIPPIGNGNFVAQMELVLDVYKRPYDPARPVLCMDESSKQLIRETREPIPGRAGAAARFDYEYERCGVCNVFIAAEPLAGRRLVQITERKTKKDWAQFLDKIAGNYKKADTITLVMDNLNTHTPGSLYETFHPEKAKALWDRFEFVYTPKHGSWLNMAEIELRVLTGQCLKGRIDSIGVVRSEAKAWAAHRNNANSSINWQFKTGDARNKLKRLYPTVEA
ncbi:MAG: IS630 family transposase [Rhodothermales bacterium]